MHTCITDVPHNILNFDQDQLRRNVYDCGNKYLDTRTFSCIVESACTGLYWSIYPMVLYRARKICLGESQRYFYDCYLYEAGGKKECLTAKECRARKGRRAYYEPRICISVEPVSNGNFVKRTDHISSCSLRKINGKYAD